MARRWIKTEKREPPVSSERGRYWLDLYIPERVDGSPINDKSKGLALGVYLGSGTFRLAGTKTATLERVQAWRLLAGIATPTNNHVRRYDDKETPIHGHAGTETPGARGPENPPSNRGDARP